MIIVYPHWYYCRSAFWRYKSNTNVFDIKAQTTANKFRTYLPTYVTFFSIQIEIVDQLICIIIYIFFSLKNSIKRLKCFDKRFLFGSWENKKMHDVYEELYFNDIDLFRFKRDIFFLFFFDFRWKCKIESRSLCVCEKEWFVLRISQFRERNWIILIAII